MIILPSGTCSCCWLSSSSEEKRRTGESLWSELIRSLPFLNPQMRRFSRSVGSYCHISTLTMGQVLPTTETDDDQPHPKTGCWCVYDVEESEHTSSCSVFNYFKRRKKWNDINQKLKQNNLTSLTSWLATFEGVFAKEKINEEVIV